MRPRITVPQQEVVHRHLLPGGAGWQNDNKVSNAVHRRFDLAVSSLPEELPARLLKLGDPARQGPGRPAQG